MLVLGYWWKHFYTLRVRHAIIIGLLLVVLYFSHILPLVSAMFFITSAAVVSFPPGLARWKQTLLTFLSMLPATALTLYYITITGTEYKDTWDLSHSLQYFIRNENLAYHSYSQIIFGKIVTGIFVILFFFTIAKDHLFTREWRLGLRLHRRDIFLLMSAAFFIR